MPFVRSRLITLHHAKGIPKQLHRLLQVIVCTNEKSRSGNYRKLSVLFVKTSINDWCQIIYSVSWT